jgi:hypothetical protein
MNDSEHYSNYTPKVFLDYLDKEKQDYLNILNSVFSNRNFIFSNEFTFTHSDPNINGDMVWVMYNAEYGEDPIITCIASSQLDAEKIFFDLFKESVDKDEQGQDVLDYPPHEEG